ncbi:MFS transporter [Actinopolyspora saharensis]|uniref:MFS transporter n=1 Tax=Actinopolyspora saharensis TaxID=995062 RepID=UPI003F66D9B9
MGPHTAVSNVPDAPNTDRSLFRKVTLRLLPLLGLLYVIAYVDRSNLGFAKLTLQDELGMSATAFTLGQVFFFVAYALLEVPSNLALHRFGADRWIARIMLTWGLITMATALVSQPWHFYLARFLLGAAEAGFFPGVIYYLTRWYPAARREAAVGLFMLAGPVSFIIGNPAMGALSDLHGVWGLEGWQWIFLCTGIPAVLTTPLVLWLLPSSPEQARWLTTGEKERIRTVLAAEESRTGQQPHNPLRALADPRVLALAAFFLCFPLATYGLSFWLPTIIDGFGGLSGTAIGLISATPYLCVMAGLLLVPRLAARGGRPLDWIAGMLALAALGFTITVASEPAWMQMFGLCLASVGGFAAQPIMWGLVPRFLSGAAAAAGIGAINGIGNLGGGFGPMGIAALVDLTGSTHAGLVFLILVSLLGLAGTFGLRTLLRTRSRSSENSDPTPHGDTGLRQQH